MNAADAREYTLQFISTLKLTEKKLGETEVALTKWRGRVELARTRGAMDLAAEAEEEAKTLEALRDDLQAEIAELRSQIEKMRKQLPGLAARERSIDPDLLEQELLMAAGHMTPGAIAPIEPFLSESDPQGRMPGEEKQAETDRLFNKLEKDSSIEAALETLKAKMRRNSGNNL
jgi:phage shock protein A